MIEGLDIWVKVIMIFASSGAVYGAIRNDIKNIHEKINDTQKDVDNANKRIDDILMRGKQ